MCSASCCYPLSCIWARRNRSAGTCSAETPPSASSDKHGTVCLSETWWCQNWARVACGSCRRWAEPQTRTPENTQQITLHNERSVYSQKIRLESGFQSVPLRICSGLLLYFFIAHNSNTHTKHLFCCRFSSVTRYFCLHQWNNSDVQEPFKGAAISASAITLL